MKYVRELGALLSELAQGGPSLSNLNNHVYTLISLYLCEWLFKALVRFYAAAYILTFMLSYPIVISRVGTPSARVHLLTIAPLLKYKKTIT